MAPRRGAKSTRVIRRTEQAKKVNVREVGTALLAALHKTYHHPCQHSEDTTHLAALLVTFAFVESVRDRLYEDLSGAAAKNNMNADELLDRTPSEIWTTVNEFMEEHVFHGAGLAKAHFSFEQVGIGQA